MAIARFMRSTLFVGEISRAFAAQLRERARAKGSQRLRRSITPMLLITLLILLTLNRVSLFIFFSPHRSLTDIHIPILYPVDSHVTTDERWLS